MKTTIMDMKDKKNSARLSLVSRTGAEDDDRTQEEESGLEEHSRFVPFEHHKWIGLKPVSFARPRYDGRSKRFFGAPKYEKFKRQLRHDLIPNHAPYPHPCEVELVFGLGPLAQKPKWRWRAFLDGLWFHTSRPDVDNLSKAVLDAMNGVLWADDSQVWRLVAEKTYTESPFIRMSVKWSKQPCKP